MEGLEKRGRMWYRSRSTRVRGVKRSIIRLCSRKVMIACLVMLAVLPPILFHFRLRRFNQIQLRRCGWVNDPPLVCAHGGDSSNAFPNTMAAYHSALTSRVDCIEIDVSRSADGLLFALHDRQGFAALVSKHYYSSWLPQLQTGDTAI